MIISSRIFFTITVLLLLTSNQCPKEPDQTILAKIAFDYSAIDDAGLRRGEVSVDYEFCIPADDTKLQEILKIAPEVQVMRKSRGRIGCREGQWLLINTTRGSGWKEALYAIAGKDYVAKIIETHYE